MVGTSESILGPTESMVGIYETRNYDFLVFEYMSNWPIFRRVTQVTRATPSYFPRFNRHYFPLTKVT